MRALHYNGVRDLTLTDGPPLPELPQGWVRVRVEAVGLCGSDIQKFLLSRPPSGYLKTNILGHEIAGTVVGLGRDADRVRVGERVALEPLLSCGRCAKCLDGKSQLCENLRCVGRDLSGGFAEYTQAPQTHVWPLPENLSFEEGSQVDLVAVAVHAAQLAGDGERLRRVAVIGDGPLGIIAAQVMRVFGAGSVTLFCKHERRASIAGQVGVTHVITDTGEDENKEVFGSFDLVIEAVGGKQSDTLRQGIALVKPGGAIVVLGVFDFDHVSSLKLRGMFYKEARLVGSNSYSRTAEKSDFLTALNLLRDHAVRVGPLISHRMRLAEYDAALELVEQRRANSVMKIVFKP